MLRLKKGKFTLFFGLAILLLISIRMLNIPEPVNYDEQNMYINGRDLATGQHYYALPHNLALGGNIAYAIIYKLIGFSQKGIRILTILYGIITLLFLYLLTKLLLGKREALFSIFIFGIFSSSLAIQGNTAISETFMVLWTILSFIFFTLFLDKQRYYYLIFSGALSAVAWLFKGAASFDFLALVVFLVIYNIQRKEYRKIILHSLILAIGFIITFLATEIIFFVFEGKSYLYNLFSQLLPSILTHVSASRTTAISWINFRMYFPGIFHKTFLLWIMSPLGIIFALFRPSYKKILVVVWAVFAALGVSFGGWWFPHYFIQIIPPLAILSAIFIADFNDLVKPHFQSRFPRLFKTGYLIFILLFSYNILVNLKPLPGFLSYLRGTITERDYLHENGLPVWGNRIDGGDYLKQIMKPAEKLYVWDTTPLIYLVSGKQILDNRFMFSQETSENVFILASEIGAWPKDAIKRKKRQELLKVLLSEKPEYIAMRYEPEYGLRQMLSFPQLNDFIFYNYHLVKRFGNVFLYKSNHKKIQYNPEKSLGLGIDLIKYYAAITRIETVGNKVTLYFEPMVNTGGILKEYTVSYDKNRFQAFHISFLPISVKSVQLDNDGMLSIYLTPGYKEKIWFARVKMEGADFHWCNKSYGVNRLLYLEQKGDELVISLGFGNTAYPQKTFYVYIIYDDGKLARTSFKFEDIKSNLKP